MDRDLDRLSSESFDLAVVGGGVLGAFIAWKASAAGWKVALVEASDFGSGTTSCSGKVLHGGLRYLSSGRLGLTLRAQRDQTVVSRLAPRLVRALPFLVPSLRGELGERLALRAAAWTWRAVTRIGPGECSLPPSRYLEASEAVSRRPGWKGKVQGGLLFHDYQLRSPERLTLAVVDAAAGSGAVAANYVRCVGLRATDGSAEGILVEDVITETGFEVPARYVVNATGSWVPRVLRRCALEPPRMALAQGLHVVLDRAEPERALALAIEEDGGDGTGGKRRRRVFVMPWEGRTLVGASYAPFEGPPEECRPTGGGVCGLLDSIDDAWPELELGIEDAVFAYAGTYPVFGRSRAPSERYGASLHPLIVDHEDRGEMKGVMSVVATKLTTAPSLADRVVSGLSERLGGTSGIHDRPLEPLPRARPTPIDRLDRLDPGILRVDSRLRSLVTEAVREEQCLRVSDFLFRRTWLGHLGWPGQEAVDRIAGTMADLLGWDGERIEEEKRSVRARYSNFIT